MLTDVTMIILDIDGTLFDSVNFNTQNLNTTLKHFGYTYRVTEEVVRKNLGCTAEDYYKNVLNQESYKEWEQLRAYARLHVGEMIKQYGKAFDGVKETFEMLHNRGIKLILYSNCSRLYLDHAVDRMGISPFITYAECVKDNGLTKIALVDKILKMYPNEKAIIVGDRWHDVEAAKANHLPSVAATYGFGDDDMSLADTAITCISELSGRIGGKEWHGSRSCSEKE